MNHGHELAYACQNSGKPSEWKELWYSLRKRAHSANFPHCFMSNRKSKSYLAFFAREMEKSIHFTNNILLFWITSAAFAFDRRASRQAQGRKFLFSTAACSERSWQIVWMSNQTLNAKLDWIWNFKLSFRTWMSGFIVWRIESIWLKFSATEWITTLIVKRAWRIEKFANFAEWT